MSVLSVATETTPRVKGSHGRDLAQESLGFASRLSLLGHRNGQTESLAGFVRDRNGKSVQRELEATAESEVESLTLHPDQLWQVLSQTLIGKMEWVSVLETNCPP